MGIFSLLVTIVLTTLIQGELDTCGNNEGSVCAELETNSQLKLDELQESIKDVKRKLDVLENQLQAHLQYHTEHNQQDVIDGKIYKPTIVKDNVQLVGDSRRQIAYFRTMWTDLFGFKAALNLQATAFNAVNPEANGGASKLLFIGDSNGYIHAIGPNGLHVSEFNPGEKIGVSCIDSFSVRKNTTMLYVGYSSGSIYQIRLTEGKPTQHGSVPFYWETVMVLANSSDSGGWAKQHLTAIKAGQRRYISTVNKEGIFTVYRENATVRAEAKLEQKVLLMKSSSIQTVFITASGILVRPTVSASNLTAIECKGINGSTLISVVFDASNKYRAYGVTTQGELLVFFLGGEKKLMDCRVRSRIEMSHPVDENVKMAAVPQYLLISTPSGLSVFNISSSPRNPPKEVIFEKYSTIAQLFGSELGEIKKASLYTNGYKLVVVAFDNLVSVFHAKLPPPQPQQFDMLKWLPQPIFVCAVIVVGVYQYYKHRQRSNQDTQAEFMRTMRHFQQRSGGGHPRTIPEEYKFD